MTRPKLVIIARCGKRGEFRVECADERDCRAQAETIRDILNLFGVEAADGETVSRPRVPEATPADDKEKIRQ